MRICILECIGSAGLDNLAKLDIFDKATREKMRKRATTNVKIRAKRFAVLFCWDVFGRWIDAILG